MSAFEPRWQLRARFAAALAEMYGREVPAYNTLVDVSRQVNREVLARRDQLEDGDRDRTLVGDVERVSSERHGAIRVGSPREMRQVARLFSVLGMYPVGFYDLREASAKSVPVIATCFRPIETEELDRHPFRVFTSMLVTDDRRFFDADTQARLEAFIEKRVLFEPELMALVEQAEREGGLAGDTADRFLSLACGAFELADRPVSLPWYQHLQGISSVAADIGAEAGTHINHLTPRVLDIDALYERMEAHGITMIDHIQGPPRWDGPFVLLRQTSFRALDEPRRLIDADGNEVSGHLRVRFGEVEARGVALTPEGRDLYDQLLERVESVLAERPEASYQDVARGIFEEHFPGTYRELARRGLAYFRFQPTEAALRLGPLDTDDPIELMEAGHLLAEPVVYEDFLPKSAAGIFQSNLTGDGSRQDGFEGRLHDAASLSEIIGRRILDPYALYQSRQDASIVEALAAIGYDVSSKGLKRVS